MKFYRITKRKHRESAFTGQGASLYPGRWNHRHHRAVYLTESVSLAQLEILVHLREEDGLADYVLFEVDISEDKIQLLHDEDYPDNWAKEPATSSTRDIGTEFMNRHTALGLRVRSSVVHQEYNLLLNPMHADAASVIENATETTVRFDPRLERS
ncbi:RES family NAD+ phosphorylase [Hydrocarboniclastica marina]|uniref:RES domain-containing protein n=1 Tax=Hydrocarboniclastica marina TaxID=2259620 RepID=A0A4P7XL88_9ALTE|nr:RES family NAD+ phosphorylase [Hydrocarboniclastica marina]MAM00347.1 hypothetical protein [Alteromonadaceae bacterium]QCF27613.1 RES domain-containing protein [Hydrocarboniclastica marina]|tara:strand:- start:2833 stop:3297 length:465 start_codon:yes stop_codon:yes gene_type:complete